MRGIAQLRFVTVWVVVTGSFRLTEKERSTCHFFSVHEKKEKDSGGSLDSLLDTITTVVGILIILLIVVQLGADSAVKRIVEEKKQEDSKELMEMAMKQFDDQQRALQKEKEQLQLKQASQNQEQQKLIQEIAQRKGTCI